MGIDYSLCAILPRNQSSRFLEQLSKLLAAPSRRRIKNLVWSEAIQISHADSRGIAGLLLEENESANNYAFSLYIKLERDMEAYSDGHSFKCFTREGSFGSMWTSVFASPAFLLVKMTAATSGMSRVLQHSEAIHKLWQQFAKAAKAVVAYVDLESESGVMVFPNAGDCVLPVNDTFVCFECDEFSLDEMVKFIQQENNL